MTYATLGDYRRRRRRAVVWRLVQLVLAVLLVTGSASYAYQVGVAASEVHLRQLESELAGAREAALDLRDRVLILASERRESDAALAALRARYARDVPDGPAAELLARIEARLGDGVDPARLALLIDAAGRPQACAGEPETRRFVVRTPLSGDAGRAIRLGDGRIVVTGEGASAASENGLPEAWFDPARPVRLTFRTLEGTGETIEGVLPLFHRMVVDGREYRLSAVAGERAFVQVTAQACVLPGLDPAGAEVHSG